jgi:A/G-specific adenine glycosylase
VTAATQRRGTISGTPDIATPLLSWWDAHGRKDLPWQTDPTPWRVWVSEVMLQQTRVGTVEHYYERFMQAFPDAVTLADASADRVLHLWSGLGYYARARNLHRAAQVVRDQSGGEVPASFDALAALPGIGRSTAGAILALSAGQRYPILDGNVKRVLSRLFRIEDSPASPAVQRELWALADDCMPQDRVAHYTQAIMDLGATLCVRRNPACTRCPLATQCMGFAAGVQEQLPAAKPKRARPQRFSIVMLVVTSRREVLLEKRPASGIWGGLWGLPETASIEDVPGWCAARFGQTPEDTRIGPVLRHAFTHFDLAMTPVEIRLAADSARAMDGDRWLWYNVGHPQQVGLPAPVSRLISSLASTVPGKRAVPGSVLGARLRPMKKADP